jgi:uncharacterized protein (TIGR03067 family)
MSIRMYLLLVVCTLLADGPSAEVVKQEWTELEGKWVVVKMEANGKSLLEMDRPAPTMVIKDARLVPNPDNPASTEADSWKIQIDPTRKPKTITIPNFKEADPERSLTLIGIYEIEGDELKVCLEAVDTAKQIERENERPTAFDSNQGLLLIFKRQLK